jgi:signal transduction histidine kinase
MTAPQAVSFAACAGLLALTLLCVSRTTRGPLAGPLALLCLDIFGWTGAGLAYDWTGAAAWRWIDHALTPWTPPLALGFVLTFAGRRRALRATLWAVSIPFGALSAASAASFAVVGARGFVGSTAWSTLLLSSALATMAFASVVLVRHLRESVEPTERARAQLILAAAAIGTLLGMTDELGQYNVPSLGSVGMLLTCALLSVVALRLRLFDRAVPLRTVGSLLTLAGASIVVAIVLLRSLRANVAMLVLVAAVAALALVATTRRWLVEQAEQRTRREHLATLGRFSAQMAHDLKNPLAALKGAAQLLREDLLRPAQEADRLRFADLMLAQIDRINGVVDLYGRLTRVEPERAVLDVNATVRDVLALQALADGPVEVRAELGADVPSCGADGAMIARVIENLLRNAIEAMPSGGTVVVRTTADGDGVVLSVEDTGCGMDARTQERAFDDFFTTKPQGTGLGLAFVRRIVEAHGGAVTLASKPGRGTIIRVRLPAGRPPG